MWTHSRRKHSKNPKLLRLFPNLAIPEMDYCWKTGCEIKKRNYTVWPLKLLLVNNREFEVREMHLWLKVINKAWENIFHICPNLPGLQAASNFAATIRRYAWRVVWHGACNCCRAFLPLYVPSMRIEDDSDWLQPHAQNILSLAPQHKVKMLPDGDIAFDDTFDRFSLTERRGDKDGNGNQS